MAKSTETVDSYIRSESPIAQKHLKQMRALVRKAAPKATERLAWGMPTIDQEGIVVTYAAFTKHLSLFPGAEAMKKFKKEFSRFQTSKGTVQVPFEMKLPVALFAKVVKYRVKENLRLAALKQAKKAAKKKALAKAKTKSKTQKK